LLSLLLRLLISRRLGLLLSKCRPAEEQGSCAYSQCTAYVNVKHGCTRFFSSEG
jgi:hypothetical protein